MAKERTRTFPHGQIDGLNEINSISAASGHIFKREIASCVDRSQTRGLFCAQTGFYFYKMLRQHPGISPPQQGDRETPPRCQMEGDSLSSASTCSTGETMTS